MPRSILRIRCKRDGAHYVGAPDDAIEWLDPARVVVMRDGDDVVVDLHYPAEVNRTGSDAWGRPRPGDIARRRKAGLLV